MILQVVQAHQTDGLATLATHHGDDETSPLLSSLLNSTELKNSYESV